MFFIFNCCEVKGYLCEDCVDNYQSLCVMCKKILCEECIDEWGEETKCSECRERVN